MSPPLRFWVVFLLAWPNWGPAQGDFTLLTAPVSLPDRAERRPIWLAQPLSNGRLAVGYSGGFSIGIPHGAWQHWSTPDDKPVRTLAEGHGRLLVGGAGFIALVEPDGLSVIARGMDDLASIVACPEGWLMAADRRLSLFSPQGEPRSILWAASLPNTRLAVSKHDEDVWLSYGDRPPALWRGPDREPTPSSSDFFAGAIFRADGPLVATNQGVYFGSPRRRLDEARDPQWFREGPIGVARSPGHLMMGTYTGGLYAFDASGRPVFDWKPPSPLYAMQRTGNLILLPTEDSLLSATLPDDFQFLPLKKTELAALKVRAEGGVVAIQVSQTTWIDGNRSRTELIDWPEVDGAWIEGGHLFVREHRVRLSDSLHTGVAVAGRSVAVLSLSDVEVLNSAGKMTRVSPGSAPESLQSDGKHFYIGTADTGVAMVDTEGRVIGQIADGRARAEEVSPGEVMILARSGEIYRSDGRLFGHLGTVHPVAATREADHLLVLGKDETGRHVIGSFNGTAWIPFDVPGLENLEPTALVATAQHLFIGGNGGLIRARLPLPPSPAPSLDMVWSAPETGSQVRLPRAETDRLTFQVSSYRLPPYAAPHLHYRLAEGTWREFAAGAPQDIALAWGKTSLEVRAQLNGRTTRAGYTLSRPFPWPLRPWAWPLHLGILSAVGVTLVRLRTRQLQRRNAELEQHVASRTLELRKANAAKEEFLAGISHEIRNPLNGVVGICSMLADRDVGAKDRLLVRTLGGCADQLRSMVDDILDFSRIERGEVTLTKVDFELRSLIEESAYVMDPELKRCSLMLPDQDIWLHGDSGKLRQLVCNLVSNALKYGEPPEAGIEASVQPTEAGRARLRIAVRNTGPTIPAEDLPGLFESFRRGQGAGVQAQPGSGLGLAVCRRLVHAMGGRIFAASEHGLTEFAIDVTLPLALPPASPEDQVGEVSLALAIEDEDYNRIALGHVLRKLGYKVDWAADAATALRLAADRAYDVILTDWRLPDMAGDVLCRRLLALQPEPLPPVIAVTAYSAEEKLQAAIDAGMAGYVTKPVTPEKLRDVIRRLSSGLRPKRSLDTRLLVPLRSEDRSPLASLGSLAPSAAQLAHDIRERWQSLAELAEMQDPRTASRAHALRSLLLLAGEEIAAEQTGLIENAAEQGDHKTIRQLLPFATEEISAACDRLRVE